MGSSTTTRNFGMRRFTNLVREGRLRGPATELRLGTAVEQDLDEPDYVKEATAAGAAIGGNARTTLCGILWYEHDSQTYNTPPFGGPMTQLVQDLDFHAPNRLVQVLHGPGAKVWLRNTDANTTEPGLNFANTRDAVTMVNGLGTGGVTVGELLGWNATSHYWDVTTTADEAILRVTFVDDDNATLDAELLV